MKQYIVDAFTTEIFKGNQAAVCIMNEWISDELMKNIAKENNFSETAFAVKKQNEVYDLRWFTPADEIDFCGHATLATSFVLFNYYEKNADKISFHTKRGNFDIFKDGGKIRMEFEAYKLNPVPVTDQMEKVFGFRPTEAYIDRDLLCVFDDENIVRNMSPDQAELKKLDGLTIAVTAKGSGTYDCVSRVFCPELGIMEDPVTGSTHCMIAPYWSKKLNKKELVCFQSSERTGELFCRVDGEKVSVTGNAVLFGRADILE
ncbi:MAG: PhzF family phenazine biosynthesis protein [Treponema sp.]|nr:PhzF family phenazine biosynthesis protein [Candidatus Treponema equifaecale]